MALDTKLIGQALGEGRPLDLAGAVRPAIMRGEQAFARTAAKKEQQEKELKAENQRRESLQARAISQLKDLDQTKVSPQIRDYITEKAFALKQAALNIIQDKNIDPITAQLEIQKYMSEINNLSAQANDFKEWQVLFADTTKDDLSKLNTPEIMNKVNDIQSGKFERKGDVFVFSDGSEYNYDDMLKIRHINKRSDKYMQAIGAVEKLGLQSGVKGMGEKVFDANLNAELKSLELTDADYASIAVDYLGMDPSTSLGARIKADFEEDGDFDDEELKNEVYTFVTNEFKKAAKTTYGTGKNEYDLKTAVSNVKTPDPSQIAGQQLGVNLITSPVERFKEITDMPTSFDETTGIFSYEEELEDGKTQTVEYNMTSAPDIIRLARSILENEGETASNKSKIIASLKDFLLKNKPQLEAMSEFSQEADREKRVNSVLEQIKDLEIANKFN